MDNIWKTLVDEVSEVILICDEQGVIRQANGRVSSQLDYSVDELIGESIDLLFLDKNYSSLEAFEKAKKKPWSGRASIYRKNKTCYLADIRVIYEADNNQYILIAEDRTDIQKAEKEIEFVTEQAGEAAKAKDEFTANVTHELRTPVNGIKGHTQYLLTTELTKEQTKELKIINECCLTMEKLINNILDFAKLQAGKFDINNREFAVADFMRYITETNGKLIEDKGLRFIVNVDPSIPERLYGDDFRLTQVLNNLLSNAMKFTPKGYIAIEVTKSMQHERDIELYFMVMDSGVGVAPEKKDALFESFTQADGSISRTYGGTGLGLSITKQLVELMNGSIRLESELGKGSSFIFTVRLSIPESVELDDNVSTTTTPLKIDHTEMIRKKLEEDNQTDVFGTDDNLAEIEKISEKLELCIELENFVKAEKFADTMKNLVADGPSELKPLAFRLQMMVRKEDGENAIKYFNELMEAIKSHTE